MPKNGLHVNLRKANGKKRPVQNGRDFALTVSIFKADVLALLGRKHGMARVLAKLLDYGCKLSAVFPSVERLAAEANASEATVYSLLDLAERLGLVARDKARQPGANWDHNVYRFAGLAAEFIKQHRARMAQAVRRVFSDAKDSYKREAARFQALLRRGKTVTPPNSGDNLSSFFSNEKKKEILPVEAPRPAFALAYERGELKAETQAAMAEWRRRREIRGFE